MKCFNHPDVEAVGVCVRCGKAVCKECQRIAEGKVFCPSCFEEGPSDWFDFRFAFKDFGKAFREFVFPTGRCPHCGRSIRKDFKVCPYCQTPLKIKCPNCSRSLEPDWVACPYCGHKIQRC